MSVFEKHRFEIWNPTQHPFKHTLSDFAYIHPSVPWVTSLEGALNAIFAATYPNTKQPVNTPSDLPTGVDTPNVGDVVPTLLDYRVVLDDGDGKAAGYRWEQREGEATPSWHKIYDMDWGEDSILSNFLTKTNDTYVSKKGQDDVDANGNLLTGDLAGQYIYGGASANTNLTLYANSGDGVGAQTGFIQFGDQIRAIADATIDIGTATRKFKDLYLSGSVHTQNIDIVGDTLTSSTGSFNFDNDDIDTTGSYSGTNLYLSSFVELDHIVTPTAAAANSTRFYSKSDGKLYRVDELGTESLVGLDFSSTNDNRLIKSDGISGSAIQETGIVISDLDEMTGVTSLDIDSIRIDGSTISTTLVNENLNLTPNGTGSVVMPKLQLSTFNENSLYVTDSSGNFVARDVLINSLNEISGTTKLTIDNMIFDGNTIVSTDTNGPINLIPNGSGSVVTKGIKPSTDNSFDVGALTERYKDLYVSGSFNDGTNSFLISELMKLRDASVGASIGHSLFWTGTKWEASAPDSEIDHGTISGLLDDDHTQYVAKDGRATGQTINGGTGASDNLTLSSTTNATKGMILFSDDIAPSVAGNNIGSNTLTFGDLYMTGEGRGFRVENFTTVTMPSSSAANIGRLAFDTTTNNLMVDTGLEWITAGNGKYIADIAFDGVVVSKDIDVSSKIDDARNCIIQLLNNNNDFDRIYCAIKAISATTIRIETNIPLTAGSYRLIVIE